MCWGQLDHCFCRGPVNSLTRQQQWSFLAVNANASLQEDCLILIKINFLSWLYTTYLIQLLKLLNFNLQGFFPTRHLEFILAHGPKIIDWPLAWGAQLCVCMGEACIAEVLIHHLTQETSAWLTLSLASLKGVLSIFALLMSYIGG